jgi:hypothetical protein
LSENIGPAWISTRRHHTRDRCKQTPSDSVRAKRTRGGLTDNRLLFTGKAAAHIADAGHLHNEQPVTLSDESGAGMYHGSDTRVGEGCGAYWKFSAIVMELCQSPCANHTVRPSREAARFAVNGTGFSPNWSTGVSRCVWKL